MTSNVHTTLAANRLDPNIQADGHLNSGAGVGGTSEQTIQKEGIEHIKSQTFGSSESEPSQSQTQSQSQSQSQSQVHQEGIDHIKRNTFGSEQPAASHATTSNALGSQPPASNPGSDDATGGIGSGSGGVSSTANIDSLGTNSSTTTTQPTTTTTTSVIGSTVEGIKSYLGFGSSSTTTSTQKEAQDAAAPGYGTVSGVTRPDTDGPVNDYHPSSAAVTATNTNNTATSTSNPNTTTTMSDSTEPSQADKRVQDKTADDVPTTEAKNIPASDRGLEDSETTTGADKQTEDTTDADQAGAGPGDKGETNKAPAAAGGHTGAVENKSAIPTAGGERLGEKHWGESKIVPDNPKPQEGAGVSSAAGQPTDQVKDNTAANTGSATGGPHSHGEKESVVDKLKDKIHMGHKKE